MNKKVLLGLVAAALFSSLVAIAPIYAANQAANHRGLQAQGMTYEFELIPDGWSHHWYTYSDLYDLKDRDMFIMHLPRDCKVTVVVMDCCMMGDTIAVFMPLDRIRFRATSPSIIIGTHFLKAGTYTFYIGYIEPHTGVFPAGYEVWFFAHV